MVRKYTVDAELKDKGFTQSAKGIKAQISALEREGKTLQTAFKVTGDFKKLNAGMSSLQKGLRMSEAEVKRLQTSLAQAGSKNLSTAGVTKLENELIRARSQAERFKTSMAQMEQQASGASSGIGKAGGSVKSFASNLLSVGSGFGNIVSGVTAGFNAISNVVQTGAGYVNAFGQNLMNTYDQQVQSQKTLSAVLSDGAEGYKTFNKHIDEGNLLLRSQKGDLNEIGATLASYTQMGGQRAFDIANSINAVGDSLSVSTEAQKQFSVAVAQAMGSGALHAQDFNQMMQTALGANFKKALIDAANSMNGVGKSTEDMAESIKKGEVTANQMKEVFGSDWANKMAAVESKQRGIKVSAGMMNQAMKDGTINVQNLASVLGSDYLQKLTDASNAQGGMVVNQENFKQAMEDGVFSTEVMNAALDSFIKQGQEVASAGPSTFGQVKQMITNAFSQEALKGFQDQLKTAGFDFAQFGNDAGNIAGTIGGAMGKLAGDTANAMLKYADANGDGKVSNEELGKMADKVSGKVQDFFNNINSKDVQGFVGDMREVVGALGEVIGWVKDAIDSINWLNSKLEAFNPGRYLSRMDKGGIFGFGNLFMSSPMTMEGMAGDNVGMAGVAEKVSGSMSKMLPFNAQLFAGSQTVKRDMAMAVGSVSPRLGSMTAQTGSKTIIFNQTLNGTKADDGGKDEILRILAKNGYDIKFKK